MNSLTNQLQSFWESRLLKEYPQVTADRRTSLLNWLLGNNPDKLEQLSPQEVIQTNQRIDYRYQILRQHYLSAEPLGAYCHLMSQLGSMSYYCPRLQHWSIRRKEHQKTLVLTLQAMIQDILANDRYIQKKVSWIAQCTSDVSLRNALLLTHLEEYCRQSFNKRPRLLTLLLAFLSRQAQQHRLLPLQKELMQVLSTTTLHYKIEVEAS